MKVETKVPYGSGHLMTNSPESWPSWTVRSTAYSAVLPMHANMCIPQLVETRDSVLTGHKAKLSVHTIRREKDLMQFFFFTCTLTAFAKPWVSVSQINTSLGSAAGLQIGCCFSVYLVARTFS